MGTTRKVVWAEGVFLGQQHFQFWEAAQANELWRRLRTVSPNQWGFVELQIDEEALSHGRLQLQSCEAVFPDGRHIRVESDADLPGCNLDELDGAERVIHLAMPVNPAVRGLSGYSTDERISAWRVRYEDLPDQHDSDRIREVALAEPELRLLHDDESRDAFTTIPVARIIPAGLGRWRFCDRFVPPLVRIDASNTLMRRLRQLLDLGRAKAGVLRERWQAAGELSHATSGQLSPYLCLDVLAPALARLSQRLEAGWVHPETLFLELLELEARLRLIVPDGADEADPVYRHDDPGASFGELEARLTRMLGNVVPTRVDGLHLEKESRHLRVARELNPAAAKTEGLYLAVRGLGSEADTLARFVSRTRVCAREDLEAVVGSGLSGIPLRALEKPPAGVTAMGGVSYFQILTEGDYWERVRTQRSLAVFLAADDADLKVELIVGEVGA